LAGKAAVVFSAVLLQHDVAACWSVETRHRSPTEFRGDAPAQQEPAGNPPSIRVRRSGRRAGFCRVASSMPPIRHITGPRPSSQSWLLPSHRIIQPARDRRSRRWRRFFALRHRGEAICLARRSRCTERRLILSL
jgi:hypothetical protein